MENGSDAIADSPTVTPVTLGEFLLSGEKESLMHEVCPR